MAIEREPRPHVERADAFRRVQLVRGERQRVGTERADVEVDLARRLHCVAVQMDPALAADARHLRHRLHHARLVVGEHHRHQPRVVAERVDDGGRRNFAAARRRHDGHGVAATLELAGRLEHRRMLDGRCDNVVAVASRNRAEDSGIVRLGAAARKDDFPRGRADQQRHRLAGVLDTASRRLAFFMNGGCVSEDIAQRFPQGLQHRWMQRGGRVVVEINPRL